MQFPRDIQLTNATQGSVFGDAYASERDDDGMIITMIERLSMITDVIEETAHIAKGHADRLMGDLPSDLNSAKSEPDTPRGLINMLNAAIEAAKNSAVLAGNQVRRFEKL